MKQNVLRTGWTIAAILLLVHAIGDVALAASTVPAVPEIDGGAITAGLGALGAGLMMLRAWRGRQ